MKLVRARVTNYKSINDSGWVTMDGVTCLVGKNESGKTAFLHALRRLNPVPGADADFALKDFPRKGYVPLQAVPSGEAGDSRQRRARAVRARAGHNRGPVRGGGPGFQHSGRHQGLRESSVLGDGDK